jgi:hypothetical protein
VFAGDGFGVTLAEIVALCNFHAKRGGGLPPLEAGLTVAAVTEWGWRKSRKALETEGAA